MTIACAVVNAAIPTITPGTMTFKNPEFSSDVRIAFDLEGEAGIVTLEKSVRADRPARTS